MKAQADDNRTAGAEVDPHITYPCYKSFDEFIDVGRLKTLDGLLAERIGRHVGTRADAPFTNTYRLKAATPEKSGQRMIRLTESLRPFDYYDLDCAGLWRPTQAAEEFAELMDFIATLPFEATGRIFIMYDDSPRCVPAHQDHLDPNVCHEFIWLRTNLEKPFYVLNQRTGEKLYVDSYSAWFDTVNQYHGCDARDRLTFSVRVDGRFTEEFRRLVPRPAVNPASAPALWACGSRP